MTVVADTSPLVYLVLIGAVDVLPRLYGRVLLPQSVARELDHAMTPPAVRSWVRQATKPFEIRPDPPSDANLALLDQGERAAIGLAIAVGADHLLMDDSDGRVHAKRHGLSVIGTLGVLAESHENGFLDFEVSVAQLRQTNFYFPTKVVDALRRQLSTGTK